MEEQGSPKEVYRLKIVRTLKTSARKVAYPTVLFDWADKADALAAKELLDKAMAVWPERSKGTKVEFVTHVPDVPLE